MNEFYSEKSRQAKIKILFKEIFELSEIYGLDIFKHDSEYGKCRLTPQMLDFVINEGLDVDLDKINNKIEKIKDILKNNYESPN